MSCLSCPCHFKWPIDSMGTKRDPINCEKAWLDFAVRLLSREAVGKGRGQETVWGAKCKPSWWDRAVRHPWKNPTANPKDTKEVLLEKYLVLESHLRDEKRFPSELEEESRLWKEGRYRELFLMTSLTSLLGKVTSVHSAVEDACIKVNELKAEVDQSILVNIQNCLKASLKATEQLNNVKSNTTSSKIDVKATSKKRNFRHSDVHKENVECPPKKQRKLEHQQATATVPIPSKQDFSDCRATTDILTFAQRLMAKRKTQLPNSLMITNNKKIPTSRPQREILPKVVTQTYLEPSATLHTSQLITVLQDPSKESALADRVYQQNLNSPLNNSVSVSLAPACTLTVTPEQLGYLMSQKTQQIHNGPVQLEFNESPTDCSSLINEKPDNFRIDPHLSRLGESHDTLKSTETITCSNSVQPGTNPDYEFYLENPLSSNTCFDNVPQSLESEMNKEYESYLENSACTSVIPSEEMNLSFLKDVDFEELCGELFKESQSSNVTDLTHISRTDTSHLKNQNPLDALIKEGTENSLLSNIDCTMEENENWAQTLPGDTNNLPVSVTDLIGLADHPTTTSLVSPSSSLDIGYCSEESPCGSASSTSKQETEDLDPFLLDNFFSYAENPLSFDLHC
ncbi:hypothetical protein EGW08_022195 [Elysia chlorotica]|uniref:Uncharacterized protein n=1 Tax=Elysia chlorotica TaxID=188477 RepID=A0A433SLL4_ELYCH|nr:hypothetical protein EGW08_022195 [Elysia chlorotica]